MSMTAQRSPVDIFINRAQTALEELRAALHEINDASTAHEIAARDLTEEVEQHLAERKEDPPGSMDEED